MANAERCVCCGEIIPEGRMVCPNCEVASKGKRLIDANALLEFAINRYGGIVIPSDINTFPTVDAVELPKGKPGDYLEWDNGTGFKQIYHIHSVMICEYCMRYELEKFAPVVNHPDIVRIMSREEAEKEWHERCARERTKEEPTLTADEIDFDYEAED